MGCLDPGYGTAAGVGLFLPDHVGCVLALIHGGVLCRIADIRGVFVPQLEKRGGLGTARLEVGGILGVGAPIPVGPDLLLQDDVIERLRHVELLVGVVDQITGEGRRLCPVGYQRVGAQGGAGPAVDVVACHRQAVPIRPFPLGQGLEDG